MPEKTINPDRASLDDGRDRKNCAPSSEIDQFYLVVPVEEARKLGARILARHEAAFEVLRNI